MIVDGPVWAVVVAAGSGTRFGGAKQFADLAGRPVVSWAVEAARSVADGVVLVVPPDRTTAGGPTAGGPAPGGSTLSALGVDAIVAGGDSRSASVRSGLAAVPDDAAVVIVHDAARPLASPTLFRAVLEGLGDSRGRADGRDGGNAVNGSDGGDAMNGRGGSDASPADGAICGVPVADTLKRLDGTGDTVAGTVDRAGLVAVQTPQAFRAEVLRRAHAGAGDATDDAALVEAMGGTVRVVPGDPRNLKLTTPADLDYAAHLLAAAR